MKIELRDKTLFFYPKTQKEYDEACDLLDDIRFEDAIYHEAYIIAEENEFNQVRYN